MALDKDFYGDLFEKLTKVAEDVKRMEGIQKSVTKMNSQMTDSKSQIEKMFNEIVKIHSEFLAMKDNSNITDEQGRTLKRIAQEKANSVMEDYPQIYKNWEKPEYFKALYMRIWGKVRREFNFSGSPLNLKKRQYGEVVDYIKNIQNSDINYPIGKKYYILKVA